MVGAPREIWLAFSFHPAVWAIVLLLAVGYASLVRFSDRRAASWGRHPRALGRPVWFALGLLTLLLALESPIDEIGELFLFWVHMLQHMLIAFVAAPLLLLGLSGRFPPVPRWVGRPLRELVRGGRPAGGSAQSRPSLARSLAGALAWRALALFTHPVAAILVFNGVFSAYHIPSLYQAALADPALHALEHAALLVTAIFTWWPVVSPLPELPRLSPPARMVYVFVDGLGMTPVFAGVTFSNAVVYDWYAHAPRIMALTPLEDQQMGGIVMKLLGGAAFLFAFLEAFWAFCRTDADARGPRFLGDEADASLVLEERAHAAARALAEGGGGRRRP